MTPFRIGLVAVGLATALASPAMAQPSGTEVLQLPAPIQLGQLNSEDGLPQGQVATLLQDPRGFMWFGTQEGLARYDGQKFVVYRHLEDDPTSVCGSDIVTLTIDGHQRLWVGTDQRGLSLYDDRHDTFVSYLPGQTVASLLSLGDRLYVGTEQGLFVFDEGRNAFDPIPGVEAVVALAPRHGGGFWVASPDNLLAFSDRGLTTAMTLATSIREHLEDAALTSVLEDATGGVWLTTAGQGVFVVDATSGKERAHYLANEGHGDLSNDTVHVVRADHKGNIWLGTLFGADQFDATTGTFTHFARGLGAAQRTFPSDTLSIFEDGRGLVWFGTLQGVRILDPDRLLLGTYRFDSEVTGVGASRDGMLWAAVYTSGLHKIDRRRRTMTIYHSLKTRTGDSVDLATALMPTIFVDSSDDIWISVLDRGLVRFDPRTELADVFPIAVDDVNYRVNRILAAGQDELWLGTWGIGLVRFSTTTGRFAVVSAGSDDGTGTSDYLYTVQQDRASRDAVWLGSADHGLFEVTGDGKVLHHFHRDEKNPNSLSHDTILSILDDRAGGLWVGTYGGGLNRIDVAKNQVTRFTTRDGLPNETIYGILPGEPGDLWLSTNGGGLVRLEIATKRMEILNSVQGLQGNEFVQNSFASGASGELLFGGTSGLNAFMPRQVSQIKLVPPPLAITSIKISNKEATLDTPPWLTKQLHLGFRDSVLTFDFATLAFGSTAGSKVAYRLTGQDEDWVQTDARNVTYTNLRGGDYVFEVRPVVAGKVSDTGLRIDLEVDFPPWRRWWAYALYGLAIALIGLSIWIYQRKRIESVWQSNRLASVERDLEITGTIQAGFLPQENPVTTDRFQLFGSYRPAGVASGDWWWYEGGTGAAHTVMVGDVTGHGPGPAIVTAAVATAFRVQPVAIDFAERLRRVNDEVLTAARSKYHVILSAVEIDERSGNYTFRSAGGLPMVHISAQATRLVTARGTPLGTMEFIAGTATGTVSPGDRLILFTDGIVEQVMTNGRQIGMRRIVQIFEKMASASPVEASQAIIAAVDALRQKTPQDDDWTMTVLDWH